jgi:hypothetical protein
MDERTERRIEEILKSRRPLGLKDAIGLWQAYQQAKESAAKRLVKHVAAGQPHSS